MTYKSFCGAMVEEYDTWQMIIPREGLKHPFLLHGLLAMASLEIAVVENRLNDVDYIRTALEHNDNALKSFRRELVHITPEKQQAALAFSMIILVLGLALPQFTTIGDESQSMVGNMVMLYELVQGIGVVTLQHQDGLREAPILRNIKPLDDLPAKPLESSLILAFAKLNSTNEEVHNPALDQSRIAKLQTIAIHATCQKAIVHLEDFFSKCEEPAYRGYALAWLNMTGKDYVAAVQDADPVALLILAYWGVLVKKCGDGIWWAQSIGRNLVEELTDVMPANDLALEPCISWARGQVGL